MGGTRRQRLPRSRRIARVSEIRSILERGKRSRTAHLDVFDSPSPAVRSRVGAIVPRHGRSAVARNRLKRRLREILRIDVLPRMTVLHVPTDVMVRARREAYEASFAELRDELNVWLDRRWLRGSSSS